MSTPSWNKPYFKSSRTVSANSSDETSSSSGISNDSERWIYKDELINGIKVYVYALISGFGKGNSFLNFVSKNLISQLLKSSQFEEILSKFDNGNINYIDDQIIALLKSVFINISGDYSEAYRKCVQQKDRMNSKDEIISLDNFDSFSLSEPNSNGCSALLALIIKDRLFIANLGNSAAILCKKLGPKEIMLFQVSDSHVDPERVTDMNSLPTHCFGGYSEQETFKSVCNPFVCDQGIQIDNTIQFLLFASPFAIKIATQLNLENLDNVNTHLISLVVDDLNSTRSVEESLKNVVNKLQSKFNQINRNPNLKPNIALAYIDLQNDYDFDQPKNAVESQQQPESSQSASQEPMVDSEVDWSEFETHELRDIFTATVNSLKQNQFELSRISEH